MVSTPVAATAREAALVYQRSVNAKDLVLLRSMFADDAELLVPAALTPDNPSGSFHGVEQVMGFFATVSFPEQAVLTYRHIYEDGSTCVVELEGRLPDRTVEAVDIFTVGSHGLVTRHGRVRPRHVALKPTAPWVISGLGSRREPSLDLAPADASGRGRSTSSTVASSLSS